MQGVRDEVAKFKTYVSDGFDISDVGKIAMDVVVQLKDKFLELDGVGSILAGGALAAGLDLGKGSGPLAHGFDLRSEFIC